MSDRSFVKNAADPKQVKEAKLREKFAKQSEENDLLFVLSDVRGRRFIWRQLDGVYENGFAGELPQNTAFNLGKKAKAATLLKEIMDVQPEAYITMMKEANSGEQTQYENKESEDA